MNQLPEPTPRPLADTQGPLICALIAALMPAVLLIVLVIRWPLALMIMLALIIPGMFIAALCVALSMGWIFMLVGRSHRNPRHLKLIIVALLLGMFELLALALILLRSQPLPS